MKIGSRGWLLALCVMRGIAYVVAIPLAPFLYDDHFLILVLLRPSKEVFLAAGFALSRGDIGLFELIAAAIPLSIAGVWLFYFLSSAYSGEITGGKNSGLLGRLLPSKKIDALSSILEKKGKRFIVLGRIAVLASTMVAAAAGTLGMKPRDFLPADLIGATISFAMTVSAGYALGATYEKAGPWLTALAVAALVGSGALFARYLKRS